MVFEVGWKDWREDESNTSFNSLTRNISCSNISLVVVICIRRHRVAFGLALGREKRLYEKFEHGYPGHSFIIFFNCCVDFVRVIWCYRFGQPHW
jgi:hypothetical protein